MGWSFRTMDRATRSELVKTVEAQKEKLQKYEAKLRGKFHNCMIAVIATKFWIRIGPGN